MKVLLVLVLLYTLSSTKEQNFDPYISKLKLQSIELEEEKLDQQIKKLSKSWLNPIMLRYNFNRQNPYNGQDAPETEQQNASINFDQPIFQSGGIFYAIEYADAARAAGELTLKQQKNVLIKSALDLLINIKKTELNIKAQQLRVENAQINLKQKREQYLGGQLDSGFLNSAIIELNKMRLSLLDLQNSKVQLISAFKKISDADYSSIDVPELKLVELDEFIENSIDLNIAKKVAQKESYFKDMTMAKYLPSLNLKASYNWQKSESFFFTGSSAIRSSPPETAYYKYGFSVSLPLDFNSFYDYEVSKLTHLKSLVEIDDTSRSLKAIHESVLSTLHNIDAKIDLSKESEIVYSQLLDDTKELYAAGQKTEFDVKTLENSLKIERLSQQLYKLDTDLELLNLYEKMGNEI